MKEQRMIDLSYRLVATLDQMEAALEDVTAALEDVTATARKLIAVMNSPEVRRMRHEASLGYRLPDWVWRVEEQQRQQFGSGNGRKMRE